MMPGQLQRTVRDEIRAAISNAYYDARNAGQTMDQAADRAALKVIEIVEARS